MNSFGRKTWDKEEYAQLAKEGKRTETESLKSSLSSVELEKLKQKYTNHDGLLKESMQNLNKRVLATGLSSYKKGKQFGFHCELCNMTFKDNFQYIDHLNHKIHQIKFEAIFNEPLILDYRDNDDVEIGNFKNEYKNLIKDFVKKHIFSDIKTVKQRAPTKVTKIIRREKAQENDIENMMGFTSFGSSNK